MSDSYGTDYPDLVTLELIPEALEDGYVPLQVFVPIMESIAAGTGIQYAFLSLNWDSIVATTADDPAFDDSDVNVKPGTTTTPTIVPSQIPGNPTLTGGAGLKGGSGLSSGSGLNNNGTSGLKASSVKTGDEMPLGGFLALAVFSLGAGCLIIWRRREEN